MQPGRGVVTQAHAGTAQVSRRVCGAPLVPGASHVDERGELQQCSTVLAAQNRYPELGRRGVTVVAHQLVGAKSAHRAHPAHRELLQRQQRLVRQLRVEAKHQLAVGLAEPTRMLELPQPAHELAVGHAVAQVRGPECANPHTDRGADRGHLGAVTADIVLHETKHAHLALAVRLHARRKGETRAEQLRLALAQVETRNQVQMRAGVAKHRVRHTQADSARAGLNVERIERFLDHAGPGDIGKKIQRGVAAVDGNAVVDRGFCVTLRVAQIPAQDIAPAARAQQLPAQAHTCLTQAGRDVVVQRGRHIAARAFLHPRVQSGLARPVARRQLGVDALDERALQQKLQAILQGIDVERGGTAHSQPLTHITAVEMLGARDGDVAQAAFDDAELDHSLCHLLVRQQRTRIDVAGIDVFERQGLSQGRKILCGDIAPQVRRGELFEILGAENRAAGHADFTHPDAGCRPRLGGCHWLPQGRRRLQQRRGLARRYQHRRPRIPARHCRRPDVLRLQQHWCGQQHARQAARQPMRWRAGGGGLRVQWAVQRRFGNEEGHGPQPKEGSAATSSKPRGRAVARCRGLVRDATAPPCASAPRSRLGR